MTILLPEFASHGLLKTLMLGVLEQSVGMPLKVSRYFPAGNLALFPFSPRHRIASINSRAYATFRWGWIRKLPYGSYTG